MTRAMARLKSELDHAETTRFQVTTPYSQRIVSRPCEMAYGLLDIMLLNLLLREPFPANLELYHRNA